MKHSKIDSRNFKKKKWKNTKIKDKDDKSAMTIKEYQESLK